MPCQDIISSQDDGLAKQHIFTRLFILRLLQWFTCTLLSLVNSFSHLCLNYNSSELHEEPNRNSRSFCRPCYISTSYVYIYCFCPFNQYHSCHSFWEPLWKGVRVVSLRRNTAVWSLTIIVFCSYLFSTPTFVMSLFDFNYDFGGL